MKPRNLLVKIGMIILFSLLILSFAIWGIGDIFRGGGQVQPVAEVGDTVIDQRDFAQELSNEVANLSRRLGTPLSGDQVRTFGIPQQVLSRMISRALLDEMAARMGMLVTEEQMDRLILENPAFQDQAGRFDSNRFLTVLRQINMSEQAYLQLLGDDTMRQQLTTAVTAAAAAPQSLAEQLLEYRGERRVADYVAIETAEFTGLDEPDAAALQETYENAEGRFMKPAYKEISMIVLSLERAAEEIAVSEARVAEAFAARKDELSAPERRRVSQAVLPDEAAARALVDRLAEGGDFAAVVEEITGRRPVDLGMVTRSDLPGGLAEPVFALEAGEPGGPIETALGWHVVLVSEVEPAEEATLERHREALREELAREQAINLVIEQANRFDEELAAGATLEQAAERLNLEIREIPAIDDRGRDPAGELVEGLPALQDFLEVLNDTAVGETSILSESVEGDFFILRVDAETPPARRPLQEVRDEVIELWRETQQQRLAREQGEALAARLREGREFAAVAEAEGLTLQETPPVTRFADSRPQGLDPRIPPQLFELDQGEVSTFAVPGRQIVIKLKQILPPDDEDREERLAQLEEELTAALQDDLFQQFLAALEQNFQVSVNQRILDQVVAEF
jgi:peptidyl-prolyl cis-trans isomerase D